MPMACLKAASPRAPPASMAACGRLAVGLVLGAACCTAPAAEPPRSALEFFRGEWTIAGQESTYRETCEWLPGRGFLACTADDRSQAEPSVSLGIFGYSEAEGAYTYSGFNGSGTQRSLRGSVDEGIWRFHGQSDRGPDWRRWQVTITPTPAGFRFREEVSQRSGPWNLRADFDYRRRRPAAD